MIARLFTLGVTALCLGCIVNMGGVPLAGSGVPATQNRDVAGVKSVFLQGVGKLIIKQTGREALTVSGDDNVVAIIETVVDNGELKIRTANSVPVSPKQPLLYTLEVKSIEKLTVVGAAHAVMTGCSAESFSISVTGASQVSIEGKVKELTIKSTGAATINTVGCPAESAKVHCTGATTAQISVDKQLEATGIGASTIEYFGEPEVKASALGASKVVRKK